MGRRQLDRNRLGLLQLHYHRHQKPWTERQYDPGAVGFRYQYAPNANVSYLVPVRGSIGILRRRQQRERQMSNRCAYTRPLGWVGSGF